MKIYLILLIIFFTLFSCTNKINEKLVERIKVEYIPSPEAKLKAVIIFDSSESEKILFLRELKKIKRNYFGTFAKSALIIEGHYIINVYYTDGNADSYSMRFENYIEKEKKIYYTTSLLNLLRDFLLKHLLYTK